MRNILLSLAALYLLTGSCALAQPTAIPKLVIGTGETYTVGPDNTLKVDTLIMHDKSVINFGTAQPGVLKVNVAFIGNKCLITSKGADGLNGKLSARGGDGEHGGNLKLIVHFEQLGQLTIDTRGGHGGNGSDGKGSRQLKRERVETRSRTGLSGTPALEHLVVRGKRGPEGTGTDGTSAAQGGDSGHGGDLYFAYSTADFIPVFNNTSRKQHSIVIKNKAGSRGDNGKPRRGSEEHRDGTAYINNAKGGRDGQLQLINLNNSTSNF